MRKKYILVLTLLMLNSLSLFSQWEQYKQGLYGGSFHSLAVDSSGIIYAGGESGKIYYSTNDGQNWIYMKSRFIDDWVTSLAILNEYIIAGTYSGIFITGDKGQNWKNISQGLKNEDILTIKIKNNSIFIGTMSGGIYKSSDLGISWVEINNGLTSFKVNAIELLPNKTIIGTDDGYYESTNDGNNWIRIMDGIPSERITDVVVVVDYIFVGTWGDGIYRKSLNEEKWTYLNKWKTDNFYVHKLYNFLSAIVINGTSISLDYGEKWYHYSIGLNEYFDPEAMISKDTTILIANQNGIFSRTISDYRWDLSNSGLCNLPVMDFEKIGNKIFVATYSNGLFLTQNYGDLWKPILSTENLIIYRLAKSQNDLIAYLYGDSFLDGLVINTSKDDDPTYLVWSRLESGSFGSYIQELQAKDSIITFAVYDELFISTNKGKKWKKSKIDTSIKYILSILISENDIYLSTTSGLFKSSDIGESWEQVIIAKPNILTHSINQIDDNFYVGNSDGIFKSSDNGKNWSLICQDSSMKSLRQLIKFGKYFVGINSSGELYISKNDGVNWIPMIYGLDDNFVYSIIDSDDYLFAGTLTGSVFRIKLSDVEVVSAKAYKDYDYIFLSPNPTNNVLNVKFSKLFSGFVEIYSIDGIKLSDLEVLNSNNYSIDISELPRGLYFIKFGDRIKNFIKI